MMNITPELIEDIFNIPRDGSNIVDEEDDVLGAGEGEAALTFQEKVAEIAADIVQIPPGKILVLDKREDVSVVVKTVEKQEELKELKPIAENKVNVETALAGLPNSKIFGDIFAEDTVKTEAVIEPETVKLKDDTISKEVVEEPEIQQIESNSVGPDTIAQTQSVTISDTLIVDGKKGRHRWKLNPPSPKYKILYAEKVHLLSKELLKDGEIPYSEYYEELKQANVDTNVPTFDTEEVGRRMSEVQRWRDRVKNIQLHVNSQFWVWKQIMELLPGVLARIEYERGKQDGVAYEHLNDFVSYHGHLQGLQRSCEIVSDHLNAAYNSLSRQVSIAQPLQEVERFTTANSQKPLTEALKRYDGLATNANKAGTKMSAKQKDSGSPDEPQGWGVVA